MAKEKKKSKSGSHVIAIAFFMVMGFVLGLLIAPFIEWQLPDKY